MAISKKRFQSRADLLTLFAICAFPIHVWAIYRIIQEVPQWLLRLTIPQLIGVVGYVLMFTLLETIIVFLAVLLLFLILPSRWFDRGRLLPFAAIALTLTTAFVVWLTLTQENDLSRGQLVGTAVGVVVLAALLGLTYAWLHRSPTATRRVTALVERLVPLALLYVFLDILGVGLVLVRNLFA